jgi:sigma-B regulation protein RsbU (phosphoserine phosphatase)
MADDGGSDPFEDTIVDGDPVELYENAPCGYLTTTADGVIVNVNQTLLGWLGYERDALVGRRSFVELLTGGGRIYHETHYAPMLRMHGGVREIALELVRSDGRRLPVLVNALVDRDERGPQRVRIAVFDATERRRYEQELLRAKQAAEESEARARSLAHTLQRSFVPPSPPQVPGLDIGGDFRPAGNGVDIGGDFFDIMRAAGDTWLVVLGDVCGKGVEAAVVTSLVRHTVRALAATGLSPGEVLRGLNHVLLEEETERFCTVVAVSLRREDDGWLATVCAAGHPLPLLAVPMSPPQEVGVPGTLVGVFPDVDLEETVVGLPAGSDLVLFTDGVVEARRGREFFDLPRAVRTLSHEAGSASDLAGGLGEAAAAFHQGPTQDDIAVVAVRVP